MLVVLHLGNGDEAKHTKDTGEKEGEANTHHLEARGSALQV